MGDLDELQHSLNEPNCAIGVCLCSPAKTIQETNNNDKPCGEDRPSRL